MKKKISFEKLPWVPIGLVGAAYLGIDYYLFTTDSNSVFVQKTVQIDQLKSEVNALEEKNSEIQKKIDDLKKIQAVNEINSKKLQDLEKNFQNQPTQSEWIKILSEEAREIGLIVTELTPKQEEKRNSLFEQKFEIEVRGVYIQVLAFFKKLSEKNTISLIRSIDFRVLPINSSKLTEISGKITISVFQSLSEKIEVKE